MKIKIFPSLVLSKSGEALINATYAGTSGRRKQFSIFAPSKEWISVSCTPYNVELITKKTIVNESENF
jgi:hypothetical protein